MAHDDLPPMDPRSDEADERQLDLAREQGGAYGRALFHMVSEVAEDGGEQRACPYLVGYAVEEAEGMYTWTDGELASREPVGENLHVEIAVRDAADGRFVPELDVEATLVDPDGGEHGPHRNPLLWHPMIYHYGRNWSLPRDGTYRLRLRVQAPHFARHDRTNGKRVIEPVELEFGHVQITTGRS